MIQRFKHDSNHKVFTSNIAQDYLANKHNIAFNSIITRVSLANKDDMSVISYAIIIARVYFVARSFFGICNFRGQAYPWFQRPGIFYRQRGKGLIF